MASVLLPVARPKGRKLPVAEERFCASVSLVVRRKFATSGGGLALTNSFCCFGNRTRSGVETNLRRCWTVARPNRVRSGRAAVGGAARNQQAEIVVRKRKRITAGSQFALVLYEHDVLFDGIAWDM
jgi:hypothetical protein